MDYPAFLDLIDTWLFFDYDLSLFLDFIETWLFFDFDLSLFLDFIETWLFFDFDLSLLSFDSFLLFNDLEDIFVPDFALVLLETDLDCSLVFPSSRTCPNLIVYFIVLELFNCFDPYYYFILIFCSSFFFIDSFLLVGCFLDDSLLFLLFKVDSFFDLLLGLLGVWFPFFSEGFVVFDYFPF